jgi:hypothetical protein
VYVLDLPVDSEENCHRGVAIWGLPKSMKAFRYQDAGGTRTVEVAASGKLYFRLTFARGGRRTLISEMNQVYSVKDGRLQVCRSYLDGAAWQYTRLSPLAKRTRLELGDSGVPAQLKALDIDPRPLVVRDFDSLNTVLYLPEAR